jgi:dienelactone hydrolase
VRLRALALVVFGLLAWLFVWPAVRPYLGATALILDLTGQQPALRRWIPVRAGTVTTRDLVVPARHGAIDARVFEPAAPRGDTVAIFPGVHGGGLDEPRMNALARRFAEHGLRVLIAPLPELRRYTIRPRSTDDVEDVSVWLAAQRDLAPSGRIGLVGVSFAGGLALVAAGRPSLDGKLTLVAAMGAHGDLPRAMRYLCTGVLPDGTIEPPHDYGAVIILLAALPHFVPADQVAPLRDAILTFLDASSLDVTDPAQSAALFADARRRESALPEPARQVMSWVNARDVRTIGPKLLPYLEELGGAPALSPERSPATHAPVFLIHGAHDNVTPYTETPQLAAYLREQGNARVTSLLTPLISHANVDAGRPAFRDVWALIRFWSAMLRALGAA